MEIYSGSVPTGAYQDSLFEEEEVVYPKFNQPGLVGQDDNIDLIRSNTSLAGMYELLTEELNELACETAKYARLLRQEIESSALPSRVIMDIKEELSDVFVCLSIINLEPNQDMLKYKLDRFVRRQCNKEK